MIKNRDFKGIWIPADIWLDDRLSAQEMVILAEIDSLDNGEGCWASNEYLARFSKCSPATVSRAIKNLTLCGYVEIVSFDGRIRIMKSCISNMKRQPNQIDEADLSKCRAITLEDNVRDIKSSSSKEAVDYEAWRIAYTSNATELPGIRIMSDKRKAAVRSMIKQGITLGDFTDACKMANESDFLKGGGPRGWTADADWMFNANNVLKVIEGRYSSRKTERKNQGCEIMDEETRRFLEAM